MSVVPLHQPRWNPDANLIDAAIAGRVRGADLEPSDRAWLVAHLTHRGHSNDVIAAWLRCSKRTIQLVRTEPVAVLTTRLLDAEAAAERAASRARSAAVTPAALSELVAQLEHAKAARATLIDQLAEMRRRCDTPCPDQIVIIRPTSRRRRPPQAESPTLPLFTLGEN